MDLNKLTAEDLANIVTHYNKTFLYVSFFAYFEETEQKFLMVKELDYHIVEFGVPDEDQIKIDIEQTEDWLDYMKESDKANPDKNGYYAVDAVFRVQTDGDDFRDWSWYELEHAEIHWAHSKQDAEYLKGIDEETSLDWPF